MAAGDVASISDLGSALRSDCEAGPPTETGSGLIGAGAFDILRRKAPSARGAAWGLAEKRCGPLCRVAISIPPSIEFYHVLDAIARLPMVTSYPLGSLAVTYCDDAAIIAPSAAKSCVSNRGGRFQ